MAASVLFIVIVAAIFISAIHSEDHGLNSSDSQLIDRRLNYLSSKQQEINTEFDEMKADLNAEKDKTSKLEKELYSIKLQSSESAMTHKGLCCWFMYDQDKCRNA